MRDGEIIIFDPLGELQKLVDELNRQKEEEQNVRPQADQVR